jgi:hypothetical protein
VEAQHPESDHHQRWRYQAREHLRQMLEDTFQKLIAYGFYAIRYAPTCQLQIMGLAFCFPGIYNTFLAAKLLPQSFLVDNHTLYYRKMQGNG